MIKLRIDGKVREFETEKELMAYLEYLNPKPTKKKKKYKAIEEEKPKEDGKA